MGEFDDNIGVLLVSSLCVTAVRAHADSIQARCLLDRYSLLCWFHSSYRVRLGH